MKACDAASNPAEIETLLGAYAASTAWGAAFEDLLASTLPDGGNLADEYLRRRGWTESAATQECIAGLSGYYDLTLHVMLTAFRGST